MRGDYLAVVKQDYDTKAIYMLSSRTGEVLWHTDPKAAGSTPPMDSMVMRGGKLYGIRLHPGQAFYFAGVDCRTGADLGRVRPMEVARSLRSISASASSSGQETKWRLARMGWPARLEL